MLHDYLSIWRHRDLRLMIPARAISAFGDDMALLVLTPDRQNNREAFASRL